MRKGFFFFLLLSCAFLSLFDCLVFVHVKEFYHVSLEEMMLDPNWKVIEEGGKGILLGEGEGFARIFPPVWEMRIKEGLRKRLIPDIFSGVKMVSFEMKIEEGGLNLNFRESTRGAHQRYVLGFHENGIDISKVRDEEVLLRQSVPVNLSIGRWYEVEASMEEGILTVKLDNMTLINFRDPDPLHGDSVSFETWEGTRAKVSDAEVLFEKKDVVQLMTQDLLTLGRICAYILFFLSITFLLSKINYRYAVWFFLGCLALFVRERPTLWFSQQMLSEGFLIAFSLYTFPLLIVSSYVLRKGFFDLYSLILAGLVTNCLINFGAPGVETIDVLGGALMIFVVPLLVIDKYLLERSIITFQKRVSSLFKSKLKFSLFLLITFLIFIGYSEMGLAVSPLPFHLSVVAFIGEFVTLYTIFSLLRPRATGTLVEMLPDEKEWKALTLFYVPTYILTLAYLILKITDVVSLSFIVLATCMTILPAPLWIVLLKRNASKKQEVEEVDLKDYVSRRHLLLFLFLTSLPLFFLIPVSMFLRVLVMVLSLAVMIVDIIK